MNVLLFVKIIAIIQICLIVSSAFIIYLTHMFFIFKQRQNEIIIKKIQYLFDMFLIKTKKLASNNIIFLKKNIYEVLTVLSNMENTSHIDILITHLIHDVFLPTGRKFFNARGWYKRYIATQCFFYGYTEEDRPRIQKLISDKISLISINAGKISVQYEDSLLINTMLDVASKKRRLQQSVYIDLILKSNKDISPVLIERLQREKNIYTKITCYRILSALPPRKDLVSTVYEDIALNNTDLDIAIITYVMHSEAEEKNKILFYYASHNQNSNVKTIVAKKLGDINTDKSYDILKKMLRDSNWWVRLNAATSLKHMGDRGLAILKEQSPDVDKYAYEVAKYVLT